MAKYQYTVVATGSPHLLEGVKWRIQTHPGGGLSAAYWRTAAEAEAAAARWAELDRLDHYQDVRYEHLYL